MIAPRNMYTGQKHPVYVNNRPVTNDEGWLTMIGIQSASEFHQENHIQLWLEGVGQGEFRVIVDDFRPTVINGRRAIVETFRYVTEARTRFIELAELADAGRPLGHDPLMVGTIPVCDLLEGDKFPDYDGLAKCKLTVHRALPLPNGKTLLDVVCEDHGHTQSIYPNHQPMRVIRHESELP